jgi:hypothetical protein
MSKMLDKVSKLLMQAENAGTPEEAETFMAKVQELASINGIDLAVARMHQANKEKAQEPEQRRIACNPFNRRYNRKHFIELGMAIADANDCEYLISGGDYALLAVGFPSDLDVVEALYTHLSVQMTTECDEALKRGENREVRKVLVTAKEEIPHEDRQWGEWNGRSQYYDDNPDDGAYVYKQDNETEEAFKVREAAALGEERAKYEKAVKEGIEGDYSYYVDGWRKPVPPPKFREVPVLDADGNKQYEEKDTVLVEGRIFRQEFYDAWVRRMRSRLLEIKRRVEKEAGSLEESSETALALRDKKAEVDKAHEAQRAGVRRMGNYESAAEGNRKMDFSGKAQAAGRASAERVPIESGREVKK